MRLCYGEAVEQNLSFSTHDTCGHRQDDLHLLVTHSVKQKHRSHSAQENFKPSVSPSKFRTCTITQDAYLALKLILSLYMMLDFASFFERT